MDPFLLGQEGSLWKFAVDISGMESAIDQIQKAGEPGGMPDATRGQVSHDICNFRLPLLHDMFIDSAAETDSKSESVSCSLAYFIKQRSLKLQAITLRNCEVS